MPPDDGRRTRDAALLVKRLLDAGPSRYERVVAKHRCEHLNPPSFQDASKYR
jgi:hypothetical protein